MPQNFDDFDKIDAVEDISTDMRLVGMEENPPTVFREITIKVQAMVNLLVSYITPASIGAATSAQGAAAEAAKAKTDQLTVTAATNLDAMRGKLAGIEDNAKDDQTGAEIVTLIDAEPNVNLLTDDERSKLAGLESSRFKGTYTSAGALTAAHPAPIAGSYAHVDAGVGEAVQHYIWDADDEEWVIQVGVGGEETGASIKIKYEAEPNTNAFEDAEKDKVANLPSNTLSDLESINVSLAALDEDVTAIDERVDDLESASHAPATVTGNGISIVGQQISLDIGEGATQVAAGNDSRFTDDRTPTAHSHGNITNDGKVGSTAGLPLVTGADGAVQAGANFTEIITESGTAITLDASNVSTEARTRIIRFTGSSDALAKITDDHASLIGGMWFFRQAAAGVVTMDDEDTDAGAVTVNGDPNTAGQHTSMCVCLVASGVVDVLGGAA